MAADNVLKDATLLQTMDVEEGLGLQFLQAYILWSKERMRKLLEDLTESVSFPTEIAIAREKGLILGNVQQQNFFGCLIQACQGMKISTASYFSFIDIDTLIRMLPKYTYVKNDEGSWSYCINRGGFTEIYDLNEDGVLTLIHGLDCEGKRHKLNGSTSPSGVVRVLNSLKGTKLSNEAYERHIVGIFRELERNMKVQGVWVEELGLGGSLDRFIEREGPVI